MATHLALLVLGFVLLIKGGDWLVSGASGLARRLGLSELAIGLTIVAFGTSTPELVVSLFAGLKGSTEICIGNVIGSNIANIFLILGISAILFPLFAPRGTVWKEIPFMLLAALILAVQANDAWLNGESESRLSRGEALTMLGFFAIFLVYVAQIMRNVTTSPATKDAVLPGMNTGKAVGLIALGLALLIAGGNWVVDGAVGLARQFGISERVIGLTIVAVGTSLPELVTSVVAAYRRNSEIAVGNIVGSNIFNILFILGITGLFTPIPFDPAGNADILVMLAATVLLFLAMFTGRVLHHIERFEGLGFLAMYLVYVVWLVQRG